MNLLLSDYLRICLHRYSSHVMEKFIECHPRILTPLLNKILYDGKIYGKINFYNLELMANIYSMHVLQKIIYLTNGQIRSYLILSIVKSMQDLNSTSLVKKWSTFITSLPANVKVIYNDLIWNKRSSESNAIIDHFPKQTSYYARSQKSNKKKSLKIESANAETKDQPFGKMKGQNKMSLPLYFNINNASNAYDLDMEFVNYISLIGNFDARKEKREIYSKTHHFHGDIEFLDDLSLTGNKLNTTSHRSKHRGSKKF